MYGCQAFVHVPTEKRSKLDSKSQECIFLGYGEDQYGFRLWDPVAKKIVRSRDVVFNEMKFPALQSAPQESVVEDFIPMPLFNENTSSLNSQSQSQPIISTPTSVLVPNPAMSASPISSMNLYQHTKELSEESPLPSNNTPLSHREQVFQTHHNSTSWHEDHGNREERLFQNNQPVDCGTPRETILGIPSNYRQDSHRTRECWRSCESLENPVVKEVTADRSLVHPKHYNSDIQGIAFGHNQTTLNGQMFNDGFENRHDAQAAQHIGRSSYTAEDCRASYGNLGEQSSRPLSYTQQVDTPVVSKDLADRSNTTNHVKHNTEQFISTVKNNNCGLEGNFQLGHYNEHVSNSQNIGLTAPSQSQTQDIDHLPCSNINQSKQTVRTINSQKNRCIFPQGSSHELYNNTKSGSAEINLDATSNKNGINRSREQEENVPDLR